MANVVVGIDYRPYTPDVCPYCGASPLVTEERQATFTVANDETWSTMFLYDVNGETATHVDLKWEEWTCPNTHTGPALQDLPGLVSATLAEGGF